jgi:ribonuclease BN (tRNA processing enzyme)
MSPSTIQLTVLGAGPSYTDRPGATGASYLVEAADTAVLLDLGQGSFPRLTAAIEPSRLDAVVVSHLHPDHFIDLIPLRLYLTYEFDPPRRLRVLGPAGLAERIDAVHARPGFTAEALDCARLGIGIQQIGAITLESRLVTHTDESYAVRLSLGSGPGLVYSGDCGVADDLAALIRPGDTLLVEDSFGVGPVPAGAGHLDAPGIARLVESTGPREILLTHIQMGFDPEAALRLVAQATTAPVRFVDPGDRFDLPAT